MAIKTLNLDLRDLEYYRRQIKQNGFMSASYLSMSGFDVKKLRKLAEQGKMSAIRCQVGKSVRWYYYEAQAELAHLKGEA
jgi:hypothetical protein